MVPRRNESMYVLYVYLVLSPRVWIIIVGRLNVMAKIISQTTQAILPGHPLTWPAHNYH